MGKAKTLNNVVINMTLKSTQTRARLSTSSEDLAVQMGKINKWYDSLVPTGGASGNILEWDSDGVAKWVAPSFLDEKVKSTLLAQSTAEGSYRPTFVTGAGTGGVNIIDSFKVNHTPGTTSAVGNTRLILGNATASGTANNEEGQLKLYSSGTSFHTLKGTTVSSEVIHVLPSTGGTVLNHMTTTYTQTSSSSADGVYEIGKIKINGTTTTIYGHDVNTTYTATDGIKIESNVIKHTNSIATAASVFKKISYDAQGHITGTANVTKSDIPALDYIAKPGQVGSASRPIYINSSSVPTQCDTPSSGAYWAGVPYVGSNGVMEIGKYIDFHGTNASTNDYDYRISAETQVLYLAPKSSGDATYNLIRMQSPDYNQIQFQTTKSGKAYTSTGIVAYPLTTSGQTMLIQSDGNTVVGGGESPRTLYSNSYDNMDTAENETLYLAADSSEIHFITNCQSYSGRKVLKVQDGQLVKTGGQWIWARDTAPVYANKPNTQDGGYYPAWFAKTKSGGWSMGVLSAQDNLYITYTTDTDYSGGSNVNTYQVQFQNKSGTVALLSDIPSLSGYLPLSGGTMTGDISFATIAPSSYPAASKGIKWGGGTDAIDMYYNLRASDAGELIINMRDDANVRTSFAYNGTVKSYIDTNGTYNGNATTSSRSYTLYTDAIGTSSSTHAGALQTYFEANKSTIVRNQGLGYYSSSYSNGSFYLGYFLSGYDSNPYGGFFVCHYNTPYYVGIQNGTYVEHKLLTNQNYTSHITQLGTVSKGSATKGIYLDAGVPKEMTYSLYSTVNSGTANCIAYYSGANAISSAPKVTYVNANNSASTPATVAGLHIESPTYGNTAANMIGGVAGVFSYGDGGPQIRFKDASSNQAGALIFTADDAAATGASWHFVSTETDWNVISKRFHAKTSISIGTDKPSTSYNLTVNGTSYFNNTITIKGTSSGNASIYYASYGNTRNSTSIRFYDGDVNGQGVQVGGGGLTVLGGGESAQAVFDNLSTLGWSASSEVAIVASDGPIYFMTNCDAFANRKSINIDTSGYLNTGYIHMDITDQDNLFTTASSIIYSNSDKYLRRVSLTKLGSTLGPYVGPYVTNVSDGSVIHQTNYNSAGGSRPVHRFIRSLRTNKLAFTLPANITIEYSTNAGSSWTSFGYTDAQKAGPFISRHAGGSITIGAAASTDFPNVTTSMQTRITITNDGRDCMIDQFYIWMSTSGHGTTVDIQYTTQSAKTTWVDWRTGVGLAGWSGPNVINVSELRYGNTIYSIRFIFKITSVSADYKTSRGTIHDIQAYGSMACWTSKNNMMMHDSLYTWNHDQVATFPAEIRVPIQLRVYGGNYGTMLRSDGTNSYLLVTDSGSAESGTWNSLRPFFFNNSTGYVTMGNGASIYGGLLVTTNATSRLTLQGATTSGSSAYDSNNPRIRFANTNASQNVELIYNDNDNVLAPSSIALRGNQGGEWLSVPRLEVNAYHSSYAPEISIKDPNNKTFNLYYGNSHASGWSILQVRPGNSAGVCVTLGCSSGGATIVGAGESAYYIHQTFWTAGSNPYVITDPPSAWTPDVEKLFLSSDTEIYLMSGMQNYTSSAHTDWTHVKTALFDTDGSFRPSINNKGSIGDSTHQWSTIYGATMYENGTSLANKYAPKSHTHNYAGSSSAGGAATSANILNKNSTAGATTSGVQYVSDGLTIGTADGNAKEGSNASYKLWSYPVGGTAISSTSANIQNLRLYWNTNYFRDIFTSPNNDDIYHRAVYNGSAHEWRKILDTVTGAYKSNYCAYPEDGYYSAGADNITGALVITLPIGMVAIMVSFTVEIFNYATNTSCMYKISGYVYDVDNKWYNVTATCIANGGYEHSNVRAKNLKVRFGYNGTKAQVQIGEATGGDSVVTKWHWQGIQIKDILFTHNTSTTISKGWSISFVTSNISNISATVDSDHVVTYANAIKPYAGNEVNFASIGTYASLWFGYRTLDPSGVRTSAATITNYNFGNGNGQATATLTCGGVISSGNVTFSAVTSTSYPASSSGLYWSGSTDWAKIYYRVDSNDNGRLVLDIGDDASARIDFAYGGTTKAYINYEGGATFSYLTTSYRASFATQATTDTADNQLYANGAIEIRETGRKGTDSSINSYKCAPRIGFYWGGVIGKSIALHKDGIFYFRNQDGVSRATAVVDLMSDYPSAVPIAALDEGRIRSFYHVNGSLTGNMPATNNAVAIIQINRHPGDYDSQIGFSNNGNIYYRCANGSALTNSTPWVKIAFSSELGSYLPLAGGTMTGAINLVANKYNDGECGMDCKNSNIIGVNNIKFSDASENAGEGIMFYRNGSTWDSIWANNGVLYFTPNYSTATTNNVVLHSGNYSSYAIPNTKAGLNAAINLLDTGTSTPVDADYYISQYVGGGTTTTTYHRRPMSALWSYISSKITPGITLTGSLTMKGSDIVLSTPSSSSDDSSDIRWNYGNGNEKARLWTENNYTTTPCGPLYRVYKSDGTAVYNGRLATLNDCVQVSYSTNYDVSQKGYYAVMTNSASTDSSARRMPTDSQWWHVLSMSWNNGSDDQNNWVSQLALPTYQNRTYGMYWRTNAGSATALSKDEWVKVLDERNYEGSINYEKFKQPVYLTQPISPLIRGMIPTVRANRLAFFPGANTLWYTTPNWSTWSLNTAFTDDQKMSLYNDTIRVNLNIGEISSGARTTTMGTRIELRNDSRDTTIDKFVFALNTGYHKVSITIYASKNSDTDTYIKMGETLEVGTWGYQAIINTPSFRFGAGSSNYGRIRIEIRYTYVDSSHQTEHVYINGIAAYSGIYWGQTLYSNMAAFDHLYSWDNSQKAIFPADVKATKFWGMLCPDSNTTRRTTANLTCQGFCAMQMFLATSSMTTGKPIGGDGYILDFDWDNSGQYKAQLAIPDTGNSGMSWRGQTGSSDWSNIMAAWRTIVDSHRRYNDNTGTTEYNLTNAASYDFLLIKTKPSSSYFAEMTTLVPAPKSSGTYKTFVNWPGVIAEASSQPTRTMGGYIKITYTDANTCKISCILADYYLQAGASVTSGSTSGFTVNIKQVIGMHA